ncbi:MAG: hypothetical protein ABI944_04315 [Chthoniobacterales bacterium]
MRRIAIISIFILLACAVVHAAQVKVEATPLPAFRPALPGSGPDAIVNRIDTTGLIKNGQKDGYIMFSCAVSKTGEVIWSGTYHGTVETRILEEEVLKRLDKAKFVPAVYEHQPVEVIFYGTVVFANINGKARLRIFCNQELDELKKESDFVSPQPVFGASSAFDGFHYPKDIPVVMKGFVEVEIEITAAGKYSIAKVTTEEPPLIGFGEAALKDLYLAKFVPAFRNGKPVASKTTLHVFYKSDV